MSIIKLGFCSKLTDEFDGKMKILRTAEIQFNKSLNDITDFFELPNEWSPHWAANLLKKRINENINSLVPNFQSMSSIDELVNLINVCVFTKEHPQFKSPSSFLKQMTSNIKSNAFGVLDSLATIGDSIIPEFNAAKLINELKNQFKGPKLDLMIPEATQLLDCMSVMCGTNITGRLENLESFLSKFSLTGTGVLDVNSLLVSQGVNLDTLGVGINTCVTQIDRVMNGIDDSVAAGREIINRVIPLDDWEE